MQPRGRYRAPHSGRYHRNRTPRASANRLPPVGWGGGPAPRSRSVRRCRTRPSRRSRRPNRRSKRGWHGPAPPRTTLAPAGRKGRGLRGHLPRGARRWHWQWPPGPRGGPPLAAPCYRPASPGARPRPHPWGPGQPRPRRRGRPRSPGCLRAAPPSVSAAGRRRRGRLPCRPSHVPNPLRRTMRGHAGRCVDMSVSATVLVPPPPWGQPAQAGPPLLRGLALMGRRWPALPGRQWLPLPGRSLPRPRNGSG